MHALNQMMKHVKHTNKTFVYRILLKALSHPIWAGVLLSILVLVAGFILSWPMFLIFEPADHIISQFSFKGLIYSWYFFTISITTIGFGDLAPKSYPLMSYWGIWSFFWGAIWMASLGSGFLTLGFKKILELLERLIMSKSEEIDHIVLITHRTDLNEDMGERLESLLRGLKANGKKKIITYSGRQNSNSILDSVQKIHKYTGDPADMDKLSLTNIEEAAIIVIDVDTDQRAFEVSLAARELNPEKAHIVCGIKNAKRAMRMFNHPRVRDINVECVPSDDLNLISRAAYNPGISVVRKEKALKDKGMEDFRANIPNGVPEYSFLRFQIYMKVKHEATVDAVGHSHKHLPNFKCNPPIDSKISGGDSFIYTADNELTLIDYEGLKEFTSIDL